MSLKQNVPIRVFTRNKEMVSNCSNRNIKYIYGNLDSFNDIDNFVVGQKVVINLTYIDGDREANLAFVSHLINACIAAGVERVLHCSTAVVAGRVAGNVVDEKTICNPITEYEKTKLCIEDKITSTSLGKIGLIIVRPTAVFGDGGVNLVKTVNSILHDSYLKKYVNRLQKGHIPLRYYTCNQKSKQQNQLLNFFAKLFKPLQNHFGRHGHTAKYSRSVFNYCIVTSI